MGERDEEMQMIRDAATRVVRAATAIGISAERDMSVATWQTAVESGWTVLLLPEGEGGLGGGPEELCVLAETLGRGLQVGTFIINEVLATQYLAAAPTSFVRTALLEALLKGARTVAIADRESAQRGAPSAPRLSARSSGRGWILDGWKSNVWTSHSTRELLVTAAAESVPENLLLLHVPLDKVHISAAFSTLDGGSAIHCRFNQLRLEESAVLTGPTGGFSCTRAAAWDLGLLATAAECLGMMKALLERTADYLSERKQFGQPLAKFQVLRHRMADMALAAFRAEALVAHAIRCIARLDAVQRTTLVAATIAKALQGARFVAEQAVQLHGGMGVSAEVPVGLFLKRVLALEATLGGPDFHRGRFATSLTDTY